jgi:type I restriction-modification system DNA methylase subunit
MDVNMNKTLENIIRRHINDPGLINKIIVTVFATTNNLHSIKNRLIKGLVLSNTDPLYLELMGLVDRFDFDDLIEAFEIAIPSEESQTNGAVYTPKRIKEYIIQRTLNEIDKPTEAIISGDVSCGCGAFLFSLATHIKRITKASLADIYNHQIFGLDISDNSITRAKILLALLAIHEGEDEKQFNFNLFVGNALNFNWLSIDKIRTNEGFDVIVGNPPYVRAKHLDSRSKDLLKNW